MKKLITLLGTLVLFVLPLRAEVSRFTVSTGKDCIKVQWLTDGENGCYGFEVERQYANESSWATLVFVQGSGTSSCFHDYSFIDSSAMPGNRYVYRLKEINNDGAFKYLQKAEIEFPAPKTFDLSDNYPNPFNSGTIITYSLPQTTTLRLSVYNLLGQEVTMLVNGTKEAGKYKTSFNASQLPSGVYLYRLQIYPAEGGAGSYAETKKMIFLK